MSAQVCPNCGKSTLHWSTLRRSVPVDVHSCATCQHLLAEEDWMAPLSPLRPGLCMNCGDRRGPDEVCIGCGLSRDEDIQVHDELRQMAAPDADLVNAARAASRVGRRLLALKLATAACVLDEAGPRTDIARALRIWLLSAIGESSPALEDARQWVETAPDPSALAWASFGQQLQHGGYPGAAADAYEKALRKDENQHPIRARRAKLLFALNREGQALREIGTVFDFRPEDEATLTIAMEVAEELATFYDQRNRLDETEVLLSKAGPYAERSPILLAYRALVNAKKADIPSARRDLKRAKRLHPDLDLYPRIEKMLKPERSSWWRW